MSASWIPLHNLQVTHGGIATYPAGATFGPRRLHDFEFVWIINGDATANYDGVIIPAPAGTVLLSRPGMMDRYDWGVTQGTTHAFFHFDFTRPARGWPVLAQWPLARPTSANDVLRPLFRYVLEVRRLAKPERTALLASCVELMLRAFVSGHLQTAAEPAVNFPAPVEKAMRLIGEVAFENPPRALALTDLGRVAAVSPEHLCRLFARHLHLGPLECLRLARLERAATLLGRSNMSSKEIATVTGFANPYHFSNAFKKVYHLSPTQYRHQLREGVVPALNPIVRLLGTRVPTVI